MGLNKLSKINYSYLIIGLVLFVSMFLRLHQLGLTSIYGDEKLSVLCANGVAYCENPPSNIFSPDFFREKNTLKNVYYGGIQGDGGLIIYNSILHFWVSFFGNNDFSFRILSVVFAFLTSIVGIFIARLIFDSQHLIVLFVFLISFHPLLFEYSRIARMYTLATFLNLWGFYFFLKIYLNKGSTFSFIAFITINLLALLTHYFTLYIYLAELFVLLLFLRDKIVWKRFILLGFIIIGLFVFWMLIGGFNGYDKMATHNQFYKDSVNGIIQNSVNVHPANFYYIVYEGFAQFMNLCGNYILAQTWYYKIGLLFCIYFLFKYLNERKPLKTILLIQIYISILFFGQNYKLTEILVVSIISGIFYLLDKKYKWTNISIFHLIGIILFCTLGNLLQRLDRKIVELLFYSFTFFHIIFNYVKNRSAINYEILFFSVFVFIVPVFFVIIAIFSGHTVSFCSRYAIFAVPYFCFFLVFIFQKVYLNTIISKFISYLIILLISTVMIFSISQIISTKNESYPYNSISKIVVENYSSGDTVIFGNWEDAVITNVYFNELILMEKYDSKIENKILIRKSTGDTLEVYEFDDRNLKNKMNIFLLK